MKRFWLHGLVLIFFPGLTYAGIGLSMSLGIIICSLIGILIEFKAFVKGILKPVHFLFFSILFLIFLFWGFYIYVVTGETKPLVSSLIIILFLNAFIASRILAQADNHIIEKFLKSLKYLTFLLIFLGWIKLILGSNFGPYAEHPKALFPYSEDSHFALTLAMFSMGFIAGCRNNNTEVFFILINILILALLLPSLSTLLVFALGLTTHFIKKSRKIRYSYFLSIFLLSTTITGILTNLDYFDERLDLTDLNNLTLLVWLQGWFIISSTFQYSNWLGVGFQMLAYDKESLPEISYYIFDFFSTGFFNVEDGGFLAAKIIGELGLFGILIVLIYLRFCLKAYKFLTVKKSKLSVYQDKVTLLRICSGFIIAFILEMFFRGLGYFSVGALMTMIAMFVFWFKSKKYT